MAGFWFKKQKQDLTTDTNKTSIISAPTTLQSAPSTPLYTRFSASTRESTGGATSPVRKVSAPKPLGLARGQRGESRPNGVEGKYAYSTHSLTSVDRGNPRVQNIAQQPPISEENARPSSQLLVDKPLPPPVPPAHDKPTSSPFPPNSPFPTQQQLPVRMSLGSQKPLPPPGSSQSSLPTSGIPTSQPSKTPITRTRSPSTSPPSISSSSPSILQDANKIQRQWSISTSDYKTSEDPSHAEPTAFSRTEDLPAGTYENGPISEPPPSSASTDSIGPTRRIAGQGISFARAMDHPETFSPENPNELISVSSQSSFRRPMLERGSSSASGTSFDRQSFVSTQIQEGGRDMTFLRPSASSTRPPVSPPMGGNASSLSRASVPYHELYPSHVVLGNGRPYSTIDVNQQRPPPPPLRNQYIAQPSSSPPNYPYSGPQNGSYERQSLHLPQRRNQPYPHPEYQQAAFPTESNPTPWTQSPSLQSNASSMTRGKPRIFAAMEEQENGRLHPFPNSSPFPSSPPQVQQSLQAHRESLGEEFLTPRSQFESLPEIQPNGDVEYVRTSKTIDNYHPNLEPPHHLRKLSSSRSAAPRQDDPRKQSAPRTKKLSKPRQPSDSTIHGHTPSGSTGTLSGTLDGAPRKIHKSQSKSRLMAPEPEPVVHLDEETIRKAGIPLDDDPFARVEGVKMLKPTLTSSVRQRASKENLLSSSADDHEEPREASGRTYQQENGASQSRSAAQRQTRKDKKEMPVGFLLDPMLKKEPPEPATMSRLLLDPQILACLLQFLSFYEWCILLSLSKEVRSAFVRNSALRETALERFLTTVGYSRWAWDDEPLSLSLQDLSDYMRGVSTPTHEYSRVSAMYIHSLKMPTTHRDPLIRQMVQRFVASTRAYNRVLLRLRAQAEKEASLPAQAPMQLTPGSRTPNTQLSPTARGGNSSRPSSRAPSPAASHSSINHSTSFPDSLGQANTSQTNLSFRSPLFKLRRAPLLRVFVPSPEGDWLSDKSVMECEAECKRAGVQHLLRLGDVVWDVAAGDEGNVGRLVWDGTYLIDLDYTYSPIGDLPKYLSTLAFPPSYFHRVIRTGHNSSNPIAHIDITPWGQEIVTNLQLLQDRIRTETPQGAYHNVMRWVHRSSFQLRPVRSQFPGVVNRIPIPNTDGLFVDPGWYGTIVVETEGTNEALADLQARCGLVAFPRAYAIPSEAQIENRKVFRILREKSRPGEIWVRAVSMKERLL